MENKHNISNTKDVNNKSELPTTDELKKSFKAGSIPLESDFTDLINLADIGRKATGQDPGQANDSKSGLGLDNSGRLVIQTGFGINIENNNVSIKSGSGIIVDNDGVSVDPNTIIQFKAGNGILIDNNNISVKPSNGVNVDSNGISIKAKKDAAISLDSDGIAVECWDGGGITVTDSTGLYLKLVGGASGNWNGISGLELSDEGVKVKAGNGIRVDEHGVSVNADFLLDYVNNVMATEIKNNLKTHIKNITLDSVLHIVPPGTIVPLHIKKDYYVDGQGHDLPPPDGWLWCDGQNDTPDLNGRVDGEYRVNIPVGSDDKSDIAMKINLGVPDDPEEIKESDLVGWLYEMKYIMKKPGPYSGPYG
ncbi:hypothetical protein [Xenorhabdus ishibashii]|uniref:Uncharacterized protein n=1 Tax=Xenorhabdus ishibashii TaxID=1034471 RepID=A0A2D0KAI7_9GAMM|nr:hypothetical protein [Xenorhabdus ishibashii]PHM60370.1 hypothetical protein Xish_03517 [Xenorhabdus ishibashii]